MKKQWEQSCSDCGSFYDFNMPCLARKHLIDQGCKHCWHPKGTILVWDEIEEKS